ncbi:MAG: family 10 glycosylhydrolase [Gemmatimonadota bacterium]|nr:family 10 glycosylhydrolase [Gemmatimonadota bacterium]
MSGIRSRSRGLAPLIRVIAMVITTAIAVAPSAVAQPPATDDALVAPAAVAASLPGPCDPSADATCLPPEPAREFRGVWIASVANIDWPSKPGLPAAEAQKELLKLLDRAQASGLNAVILQVRPSGDAVYASDIEPWSEFLTGKQGLAPSPWWDPLKFAVDEAHRRGLELHAWFNPYRARYPSAKGPLSNKHIARRMPTLVKPYGTHLWMDPGEPAVREHTVRVVLDVVKRYDVDGVHLDDYFYPYKERDRRGRDIEFPDDASYARYRYGGGILSRDDWRRENVDHLVQDLYARIHQEKPWVKFGVSPFGIWRPGFPETVTGFDAYSELYADARKWLREGWVDYFAPQLYWPVLQVGQSYPDLLKWWSEQNPFGRHLWPGNYTSKVGEGSRTAWRWQEIQDQVLATRAQPGATGNIHFSAKVFLENRDSLATRLARQVYAALALVPRSPWLDVSPQGEPQVAVHRNAAGVLSVRLTPSGADRPRWWLVQTRGAGGVWQSSMLRGSVSEVALPAAADRVAVRAVDRASVESPMSVIKLRE